MLSILNCELEPQNCMNWAWGHTCNPGTWSGVGGSEAQHYYPHSHSSLGLYKALLMKSFLKHQCLLNLNLPYAWPLYMCLYTTHTLLHNPPNTQPRYTHHIHMVKHKCTHNLYTCTCNKLYRVPHTIHVHPAHIHVYSHIHAHT